MNKIEKGLVGLIKNMKVLGALGVKAEFEAEGTRKQELHWLKDIAGEAGVRVALKIGGAEDVWGIEQAMEVGVNEIVAPMIESAYGLLKFLEAFKKKVPEEERNEVIAAVNIETEQSYNNIDSIIEVGLAHGLHGVTVGRVDLAGSLVCSTEKGRPLIVSPQVCKMTRAVCEKAKAAGMRTVVGGSIENTSRDFLDELVSDGLLDRFETRKIIFDAKVAIGYYQEAVLNAHRFELGWLENKQNYYKGIAEEDAERIPMLKKRVGS